MTGSARALSDAEARALARLSRAGDAAARERLIVENRGLAVHLAKRYAGRGQSLDDLVQAASTGLIKAVDGWDPDHGSSFSSYAVPAILGDLRRLFRDAAAPVRIPRQLAELRRRAERLMSGELAGRDAAAVAEHLGVDLDVLIEALDTAVALTPSQLPEEVVDDSDAADSVDRHLTVAALLAKLAPEDRDIVRMRYFEDLTQAQIAERVGVSQMQVSRVLRRSLDRLRTLAGD